MNKDITNYIKTECGLSEYYLLKARKGFFNKLRFYWFVAIATLRDYVEKKYSNYIEKINEGIKKDGIYYLFFLRLSPIFPFFIINLVFGLTKMKVFTFYIVSQIGMFIGTIIFVNAGVQLSRINKMADILSIEIIISFILIGIVPLIIKKLIEKFKK